MPGDTVTIVRKCGVCGTEFGTFQAKQENMMLSSTTQVWCPTCQENRLEVREVAGRQAAIEKEIASYPKSSGA